MLHALADLQQRRSQLRGRAHVLRGERSAEAYSRSTGSALVVVGFSARLGLRAREDSPATEVNRSGADGNMDEDSETGGYRQNGGACKRTCEKEGEIVSHPRRKICCCPEVGH